MLQFLLFSSDFSVLLFISILHPYGTIAIQCTENVMGISAGTSAAVPPAGHGRQCVLIWCTCRARSSSYVLQVDACETLRLPRQSTAELIFKIILRFFCFCFLPFLFYFLVLIFALMVQKQLWVKKTHWCLSGSHNTDTTGSSQAWLFSRDISRDIAEKRKWKKSSFNNWFESGIYFMQRKIHLVGQTYLNILTNEVECIYKVFLLYTRVQLSLTENTLWWNGQQTEITVSFFVCF